jgi:hypothetical protein
MCKQAVFVGGVPVVDELQALVTSALWLDGKAEYDMMKNPQAFTKALLRDFLTDEEEIVVKVHEFEEIPVPQHLVVRHTDTEIEAGYTRFLCSETLGGCPSVDSLCPTQDFDCLSINCPDTTDCVP